tara:strand:+ start:37 stop:465 length:429 start_codon:yes stop_codon:yes gene_type:complete
MKYQKEMTMSKYYNVDGMKVRVSDHEPNYSLRGRGDINFYTKSIDNEKLSVISQIESYCDKKELDPSIFKEVIKDFPDPPYRPFKPKKIEVTQEIVDGFLAIKGRGRMKRGEKYCQRVGVDSYKMSQGHYTIIDLKKEVSHG